MERYSSWLAIATLILGAAFAAESEERASQAYDPVGFHATGVGLSSSARAGREIWYKATAGNGRFHTYVMQQRLGVLIDWYRVLRSDRRDGRFATWGLINDPECCRPGAQGCPAQGAEETFGFDWCHGDEDLLAHVGRDGYRDPACDFVDAAIPENDLHGPQDQRESACRLAFGTSAGVLGLRKFPNPRFDSAKWRDLNGGRTGTWEGFNERREEGRTSRLTDASVEPPFLIGMACGACHIAFDPVRPPDDPNAPAWENIAGLVGNQYTRMSEVLASGMSANSLEWQVFSHARPGTADTSAVPNDQVNNPGTVNAIVNFAERPRFPGEVVVAWRKSAQCPAHTDVDECWCEPERAGKCWVKSRREETVHHILKGGGDSIGALGAIQRVYVNIGACAEQCWVNHLSDLRQLDPSQRNYGQTPFDIGQCRRDCPNFRAVEDRLENILDFFLSPNGGVVDLVTARAHRERAADPGARYDFDDLVADLEAEFGDGAVARGRIVFAKNCARCHSSLDHSDETTDFHAINSDTGVRDDWLGDDRAVPATEVGTYRCRALHANHLQGHVWQEFASETYRARLDVPDLEEPSDGGRGYFRNISLLNLWAHAPFLHNNAVGPELCGAASDPRDQFYDSPYVDGVGRPAPGPDCWTYDPSVEGRYALYKASMDALLNPATRPRKVTHLPEAIILDLGLDIRDGEGEAPLRGFRFRVPAGTPVGALGNFQHKRFVVDLVQAARQPDLVEARYAQTLGAAGAKSALAELRALVDALRADPGNMIATLGRRPGLLRRYMSCTATVENAGHRFGEELSDVDKNALIAFLATL